MKLRPLAPKGGNDKVYTPDWLAYKIVNHFKPSGDILEPCRVKGAFTQYMPNCDWCEIDDGIDFLNIEALDNNRWDWIVTNPPWSQFRQFLNKSMEVADNIVFLSLINAWFMKARIRDMKEKGFGMVEILMVDTPEKPWPQTGFQLGAVHISRGYNRMVKISE